MSMEKTVSWYRLRLRERMRRVTHGEYHGPSDIPKIAIHSMHEVLCLIVEAACLAQSIGNILAGRQEMENIPEEWLIQYLPEVIEKTIHFEDDYEYRRLLELLEASSHKLLEAYINRGLLSDNSDIRETAGNFLQHT